MKRLSSVVLAATVAVGSLVGLAAGPAYAATVCTGDLCVVTPDTVQTPLGVVTVSVSDANVVTVQLTPGSTNTLVVGLPFTIPATAFLPGCPGGCTRTTIDTAGGLVTIDTFQVPPGPPARFALPNLAVISIHPPGPCRVSTHGTTVTFTPIAGLSLP